MKGYMLEVCVDSVESALLAAKGGAMRLELCANLVIGGTTPGTWLLKEVKKLTGIPVHVLIRPRFGDFCYTDYEFEAIKEDIKVFRKLGADGAVIGILRPDGTLNKEQLRELAELAEGMSLTLHRAFDVCANPYQAMEDAIELGFDIILTSGQKNNCSGGSELIRELVKLSNGRIEIMAGGGVDAAVIRGQYPVTGVTAWHMSGKVTQDSAMNFRKEGVNMGLPSLSEYEIWRTDASKIREARKVLEEL